MQTCLNRSTIRHCMRRYHVLLLYKAKPNFYRFIWLYNLWLEFNSYSTQLFNNYDLPVLNHCLSNPEEWLQKRATLLSARYKSQSRKQKQTNDITERTIEWQYFSKTVSNTSTHTHTNLHTYNSLDAYLN